MGSLSTWGRTAVMNAMFRPDAAPALGTLWIAMTPLLPASTDSGDSLGEPTASSYQRAPYGLGSYYWNVTGPGQLINSRNIDWGSVSDDWGKVIAWALCTESMSGMVVESGLLQRPLTITAGMRLRIPPGAVRMTCL